MAVNPLTFSVYSSIIANLSGTNYLAGATIVGCFPGDYDHNILYSGCGYIPVGLILGENTSIVFQVNGNGTALIGLTTEYGNYQGKMYEIIIDANNKDYYYIR